MELVDGPTLRQMLRRRGRLMAPERVIELGAPVADALDAAHRAGLVHRDVKPANILLDADRPGGGHRFRHRQGARRRRPDRRPHDGGHGQVPRPRAGTGAPAGPAADLYSLGVVLYEALTGQVPFVADTDAATALLRLRRDPTPPRHLRPGLPRALDDLVMALLAREPEDRPATAGLVRDQLLALARGRARRRPHRDRRRHRSVTVARRRCAPPGPTRLRLDRALLAGPRRRGRGARRRPRRGRAPPGPDRRRPPAPRVGHGTSCGRAPHGEPPSTEATTRRPRARRPRAGRGHRVRPAPGDGHEHPGRSPACTDGDAGTAWTTEGYNQRNFGTKPGVGVMLELGGAQRPRCARCRLAPPMAGAARSSSPTPPTDLAGWGTPGRPAAAGADGEHRFDLSRPPGPLRAGVVHRPGRGDGREAATAWPSARSSCRGA